MNHHRFHQYLLYDKREKHIKYISLDLLNEIYNESMVYLGELYCVTSNGRDAKYVQNHYVIPIIERS